MKCGKCGESMEWGNDEIDICLECDKHFHEHCIQHCVGCGDAWCAVCKPDGVPDCGMRRDYWGYLRSATPRELAEDTPEIGEDK